MRIALDALGGDHGVRPNVAGAAQALAAAPDLHIALIGPQAELEAALAAIGSFPADRLEIIHCTDSIGMNEKPVEALRKKPDSSIAKGWKLTATKQVDGFVSAGNTGAVVAGGLFSKRFLKGVRRPGIAATMPNVKGSCVVMDVGANVFPKASHLIQYGVMGAAYAKHMLGIADPRIGLMNVGEEEGKGHELVQATYNYFRNGPLAPRFLGNVEGRDVHKGVADVIVTDGFVGNVLLKHAEGCLDFIMGMVGKNVVGALSAERDIAMKAVKQLIGKFHYSAAGGAPLLGIDGVCIICHGSSDERAIANAIGAAVKNVHVKLNEHITEELAALPPMGDEV